MAKKPRDLLVNIGTGLGSRSPRTRSTGATRLEQREQTVSRAMSGEMVDKVHHLVDPAICCIWAYHDRDYAALNEERCQDLITGIKAQGKQEIPAYVRRVDDGSDYQYEVICGARRHWSISWLRQNNYPQFKFLIEVRTLSDEEAFRLADIENRDREDISEYERAKSYAGARERYYESQKAMAERLMVSEDWLSRLLKLATLPDDIVAAYPTVSDINVGHYRLLAPYFKRDSDRRKLLQTAKDIVRQQKELTAARKPLLPGKTIVKLLCDSMQSRSAKNAKVAWTEYQGSNGARLLQATRGRGHIQVKVFDAGSESIDDTVEAFRQMLVDLQQST